ncbi:MAG: PQQ-binding-like beta-propeller repeat protein, partial [Opitutae bacterium]
FQTGANIYSTPALGSDGVLYVGSDDFTFYALDSKTGKEKWSLKTEGKVDSSPLVGLDGTVYFGSWDGKVYALRGSSKGPAKGLWPQFRNVSSRSGLMDASSNQRLYQFVGD